ncbi:ABC transporter ATP-binding protein [Streptomyces cellulosae]|uniref:ABC transporter ATP-binding protein n=2 Tax=Streptomyces TaxID=1883 RepID=A0ABU3JJI5_9ACTN|nr:ABC transporter ATP-binding protein [Streptomyces sp. McG7]MDQ0485607.1 ATP-binding cassette subfamily B protein [Streptomyces thermodiastaticus]MDT6974393.1 ABC transporter ATP-binding protein [Streptomyces thermocarboxydus]THC48514.1 ABC transporter ATP-binding protein [Streptomyces sp. Akac8]WSB43248.1 ABC transporter ATP-binding protein/permease [Streptomyces cellulosae]
MRTGPTSSAPARPGVRVLRDLLRENTASVCAALILSLAATAATLAIPWLVRDLIEVLGRQESVVGVLVWMVPLALGAAAASSLSGYLLARTGERLVLRLRSRVMEHSLRLPLSDVRAAGPGNLVARITSDAMLLRSVVDAGVVQVPVAVVTALGTIVLMGFLDLLLVLLAFASFAAAGCAIWFVLRRVRKRYESIQIATGMLAQRFTTSLASLLTIKAHRAERRTARALTTDADALTTEMLRASRLQSVVLPLMSLGQEVALAGIVIAGSARIAHGSLTLADFIAFILYLLQLVSPVTIIVMGFGRLQTGLAAKARFEDLLSLPTEPSEEPAAADDTVSPDAAGTAAAGRPAPARAATAVRFDGVSFSYDGRPVLRDVSFSAPRRGLTAVVGHSGAGKSTLFHLVERFLHSDRGTVSVLDRDVTRWTLHDLRSRLGYVDQSFTLLEGTVRENLLLGLDTPPGQSPAELDERLSTVLRSVDLHDAVHALPHGLDTELGRATDLSGGQRQRLALARALLSPAEVLLLDEPTSQMDAVNELRLRDVVDELARDRSVIVIAHRMSTVMHAEHVVALKEGRVVAAGTHAELMEDSEYYRNLVENQRWAPLEPAVSAG